MNKRLRLLIIIAIIISSLIVVIISLNTLKNERIREITNNGIKYLIEEEYNEAIIEFEKVIKIDKNNTKIKKMLKALYEYKNIEDLIINNDYKKASEEIEAAKEIQDSEIMNNLIKKAEQELEKKYEELTEDKKEYLDGYWLGDGFIIQFKNNEDEFLIFSLIDDGNMDIYYNEIVKFDYKIDEDIINIETNESFDGGDSWQSIYKYRIIDENTIELNLTTPNKIIKRISQKEATLMYYGKYLDTVYDKDKAGLIYGYQYMGYLTDVYQIEAFNYKEEEKGEYTAEQAIEFMSGGINKENYTAEEIDILPGIRSYLITDTTIPTRAATKVIFEGNLRPDDINNKYLKYIDGIE